LTSPIIKKASINVPAYQEISLSDESFDRDFDCMLGDLVFFVDFFETFFNSQQGGGIISLTTAQADFTGYVANDQVFAFTSINILNMAFLEFLASTKMTFCISHRIISHVFVH